jgi:long-chain acyl-CoA synthetase
MKNSVNSANLNILKSAPNLVAAFLQTAKLQAKNEIWRQAVVGSTPRAWQSTTYSDLFIRVSKVAVFLQSLLNERESYKIAICSNSRPEWLEADLAILCCGGVVVSIYTSLPKKDISFLLEDSGAKIVFAENESQVIKLLEIKRDNEDLIEKIISFESVGRDDVIDYSTLFLEEIDSSNWEPPALKSLTKNSPAALVYTSGSTGRPKGVLQSHGNHLANLVQSLEANFLKGDSNMFLYLPLAHSFAKLIGYLGIFSDISLSFPAVTDKKSSNLDLMSITEDLKYSRAEYLPSIPRLFEKVKSKLIAKSKEKGLNSFILKVTINNALNYYIKSQKRENITIFERFIFKGTEPIRRKISIGVFGESFKLAISGGAKLSPDVAEFFAALEIQILQGYGLTETCVATNVNLPHDNRIGSVGPTFEGIEIKIAEDGEIFFRGENVCSGYYNRPEETNASWDSEGWFKTGDLGYLDSDGYLYITGRKKEVIVTAGGKKIAPTKLEQLLESSELIEQAAVFGNDRPYCVALVVLKSSENIINGADAEGIFNLWEEIQKINFNLASFERIKKARVIVEPFTIENGLLTPTSKLKRNEVRDRYKDIIWEMYDNTPHPRDVEPIRKK